MPIKALSRNDYHDRFSPEISTGSDLTQFLDVRKNDNGLFYVTYAKSVKNFERYSVTDERGRLSIHERDKIKTNEDCSFEYTCEFDLKMVRGKLVLTATSDPTVKVWMPAGSFRKTISM